MKILETEQNLDHTLLSQILSFFRAHSIPPTSSTKLNRPEWDTEFSDNRLQTTEHEDIIDGESCQGSLDQDEESEDNIDGV